MLKQILSQVLTCSSGNSSRKLFSPEITSLTMYVSFPHNSCGKPQPVLACHLGHYIDLSNLTLLWGLSVEQLYTYVFFLLWTCLLSGYLTDSILTLKGWSCVFSLPYSLNLVYNSDLNLKHSAGECLPLGYHFMITYTHITETKISLQSMQRVTAELLY